MDRVGVRLSVLNCTSCSLHTTCKSPVPFRGPSPATLAIVAEAPGRTEDEQGKPLVGPSGQKLDEWLDRAKIDKSAVAYLNAVSCFPNRTPSAKEVEICRVNMTNQLSVIQPTFILVLGGVALSSFWSGLRMGDARGRWWKTQMGDALPSPAWCLSTYHPAAVLRNSSLDTTVMSDVMKVRIALQLGLDARRASPDPRCVMCGEWADVYRMMDGRDVTNDVNCEGSLGWCLKHDGLRMGTAGKGRETGSKGAGAGGRSKGKAPRPSGKSTAGAKSSATSRTKRSTSSTRSSTKSEAGAQQTSFDIEKYRVK